MEQDFKFCPYCTKRVQQPVGTVNEPSTDSGTWVSNFSISAYQHFVKRNNKEAIADYTKAIELDPKSALAYYNRGLIQPDLGTFEEADQDFENSERWDNGQDPI